jgi:hypothetical protein
MLTADVHARSGTGYNGDAKLRTIFFGMCMAGVATNGGALCSRAHLKRLSSDPGLQLKAIIACPTDQVAGTRDYLESLSIEHHIIEANGDRPRAKGPLDLIARRWPIVFEHTAFQNSHIEREVLSACEAYVPDFLIVEYMPSLQFLPTAVRKRRPRICVITVNREAEMLLAMADMGLHLDGGGRASKIGYIRCLNFERWVNRAADVVVSIGRYDLPRRRLPGKTHCWIAPSAFLDDPQNGRRASQIITQRLAHYEQTQSGVWSTMLKEHMATSLR